MEETKGNGIKTERLWLREAIEEDLEGLHAVWSSEDVMRYWYSLDAPDIKKF